MPSILQKRQISSALVGGAARFSYTDGKISIANNK